MTKARKPAAKRKGSADAGAGSDGLDAAEGSGGEHDGCDGDDAAGIKMEEGA